MGDFLDVLGISATAFVATNIDVFLFSLRFLRTAAILYVKLSLGNTQEWAHY